MGFNSTIVIYNDFLHKIEKDKEFGTRVADAISMIDYPQYNNDFQAIETHHADGIIVSAVGGNMGLSLGYAGSYSQLSLEDEDARVSILKELARTLGYDIRKRI